MVKITTNQLPQIIHNPQLLTVNYEEMINVTHIGPGSSSST